MSKNKRGRCMADGGITQRETADELMARMTAKYGAPSAGQAQQPAPQPTPQPKPEPPKPSTGLGIMGILKTRGEQIDKAAGYADGGIVRGKGTPTSDDVPVTIKGKPYNLSDTEAVLPSKTRQALGELLGAKPGDVAEANRLVEAFIAQTNGKPPVSVEDGSNLADGGLTDEEARRMKYAQVDGVPSVAPAPATPSAPASAGNSWSVGKGQAPTIYDNGGLPADTVQRGIAAMRDQLNKPVVQSGIDTMRSQMARPAGIAAPPASLDAPWYSPAYARAANESSLSGLELETMRRGNQVAGDPVKSMLTSGTLPGSPAISRPSVQAAPKPSGIAAPPANYGNEGRSVPAPITATTPGAVVDNGFSSNGIAYATKPSGQDGISKVTAPGQSPLYTNIKPADAVAGLKNQTTGAQDVEEGLNRYARANAITQSIIDKQPMGGIAILNDPNEAANAEKTARWRQDELLQAGKYGNRAAGDAIQANAQLGVEGIRSATAQRGQDVGAGITARGQDLAAQTAANNLAGNPQERQLKEAQAQGILAQTDSTKMLADLQRKALAGDQQALASYRALTGKGDRSLRDNFMAVGGGQEYDAAAGVMRNVPQRLVDLRTGQEIGGQQKARPGNPSYEQFAAQMKQRYGDKATDAAMRQAYEQQFGA